MNINKTELQVKTHEGSAYAAGFDTSLSGAEADKLRNGVTDWVQASVPSCDMSTIKFDVELDARKLSCPLPILRTKKVLSQMQGGQILKVVATDKKSPDDFTDFCKQTGNDLLSVAQQGDEFVFYVLRRQP